MLDETSLSLGDRLRRHRKAAGLTQAALAERAGVSVRTISAIERGLGSAPRHDTLALLAAALDLSLPERSAFVDAARPRREAAAGVRRPSRPSAATVRHVAGGLPPLVGRARERALLDDYLAANGPPVLVLAGEPGIGKSRLLHEAAARARGEGWRVLEGGCQRRGGQHSYAPVLDALRLYVATQSATRLRAELRGCAWLVRLLPELAEGPIEPLPAWTPTPEQERDLAWQAVARFLANIAGPAGTLLVLDDMHWAGGDALELLALLLRSSVLLPPTPLPPAGKRPHRARPAPKGLEPRAAATVLRVVIAYRDTQVQPTDQLSSVLADLAQAELATQHTLEPLSMAASRSLLDALLGDLDSTVRGRVLQRAGGVPFFLLSCVQALRSRDPSDAEANSLPWDLAQSIRQRIAALPPLARELLRLAAVVGRWAPRALLVELATRSPGATEDEILHALDAACQARLLDDDGAEGYGFVHDVIREVVEADLGQARRVALHRRVAAALEKGPEEPPVELLAYHYSHSDERDKAVLYLERAGDYALAQSARQAAEGYYRDLAQRLDALGRGAAAARAREKLATVLRLRAQYEQALAVFEECVQGYQAAGDLNGVGRVTVAMAFAHAEGRTLEVGLARLYALVDLLREGQAWQGLAEVFATLATFAYYAGRYAEQKELAEQAVVLARLTGDGRLLSVTLGALAGALSLLGYPDQARQVYDESIPLAVAAHDLDAHSIQLTGLATIYMYTGAFATSRLYAERAVEVAERRGFLMHLFYTRLKRGILTLFTGEWTQSRVDLDWLMSLEQRFAGAWAFAYPLLALGTLRLLEGEWEQAAGLLEQCVELAGQSSNLEALRWAQSRLAERDILMGHPEAVPARFAGLLDRPHLHELDVTVLLPRLAWAYLELGDAARASQEAASAVQRARRQRHHIALADALWVQGLALARREQWTEATQALDEGLALTRAMPYPYAEARIEEAYGAMQAAHGQPETARAHWQAARAIFSRLGARRDAARVAATPPTSGQKSRPG